MDSWSACAKNVPRARNSGAGRWSSSASAPSRPALTAVAAPCRWAISKTWSSANPTPVPTRDAMRSTVSPALPTCPTTLSHASGLPVLSSTITRCGPKSTPTCPVSSAEPIAVGLATVGGVHAPRLPFICSSAPSAASSSSGVAKISRRQPQASNSSSCRLWGSHTIHAYTSGLRVTTISLTSRGL